MVIRSAGEGNCDPINRKWTRKVAFAFFAVKRPSQFLPPVMYLLYLFGWQVPLSRIYLTGRGVAPAEAQHLAPRGPLPCHAPLIKLELKDSAVSVIMTFP